MPTHLAKLGSVYYFRRIVPAHLRPFFLTARGKPRVEFMESLGTKDRREGEEKARLRGVEVDRLFRLAEAKLAALRADPEARQRAQREWEDFQHQQEGMELAYRQGAAEDEAAEARAPQRRAIIERLRNPSTRS